MILSGIVRTPWYRRNTVLHSDFNIPPIRSIIKNKASQFFENIPSIPNTALHNISNCDVNYRWRRPRATLHLPESIDPG